MLARFSLGLALVCGMASRGLADPPAPARLEVLPAKVRLSGPEATQRLVVLGVFSAGETRDLTSRAKVESKDPKVAAVAVMDLNQPRSTLLMSALAQSIAVANGNNATPSGLLVAAR